ncbi:hypothetical protein PG985_009778 [Apiospora marii]|uniref:Uncharacterized protein n=1 Tax=Apiospora marii TaxID=335849 RepID=A0ABR1RQJ4_9PEZI
MDGTAIAAYHYCRSVCLQFSINTDIPSKSFRDLTSEEPAANSTKILTRRHIRPQPPGNSSDSDPALLENDRGVVEDAELEVKLEDSKAEYTKAVGLEYATRSVLQTREAVRELDGLHAVLNVLRLGPSWFYAVLQEHPAFARELESRALVKVETVEQE